MADPAAFDLFFQQADVDRDGRVSGAEAIHFFKGTNLPQPILAKIWHASDNGHTGFLSRQEFYNALKLVTVAQSGRELTPEIMKAALAGPASSKIPAPKITLPQTKQTPAQPTASAPQAGLQQQQQSSLRPSFTAAQPVSMMQTPPAVPQNIQQTRPSFTTSQPQQTSVSFAQAPQQVNIPPQQQQPTRPSFTSSQPLPPQQTPVQMGMNIPPQQQPTRPSFTSSQSLTPQQSIPQQLNIQQRPPASFPVSQVQAQRPPAFTNIPQQATGISAYQPASSVQGQLFSSASVRPPFQNQSFPPGSQGFISVPDGVSSAPAPRIASFTGVSTQPSPKVSGFGSPFGADTFSAGSTTAASGVPVRNTMPNVQRGYRPGGPAWPKMTSADAQRYSRIFSDVDTDKDGKITGTQARDLFLSWRIPREVLKQVWDLSDQDGDSMLSFKEFCTAVYFIERFREGRPVPPVLPVGFHFDESMHQYNTPAYPRNASMMGMPQAPQTAKNSRNNFDKPVQSENKVLDSKEKLEFYRDKLQEIVLFKRKCDNRLAEITDRAAAEKREEQLMAKKYDEKYKQALEVNARLVSEEASFRDLQTLRHELRSAIAEIERGGNPNALLQTRADRIFNDLDELEKALLQRGQLVGLHVTGTTPIELPFGWQPGLQENAAEWDDNWDKFDDEGYTTIQSIMDEPSPVKTGWDESIFSEEYDFSSESNKVTQEPLDEVQSTVVDSPRTDSETSSLKSGIESPQWSPKEQPHRRTSLGNSPLSRGSDIHEEDSHGAPAASFDQEPSFDGDHYVDKPWSSAFGSSNDDIWGFGRDSPSLPPLAVRTRTERDSLDLGSLSLNSPDVKNENDFFGGSSTDWNTQATSVSVPSTPLFKTDSPGRQGSFFGPDSRVDSFASTQGRSSGVYDDPFGDTGPFSQKSDRWSTF